MIVPAKKVMLNHENLFSSGRGHDRFGNYNYLQIGSSNPFAQPEILSKKVFTERKEL